MGNALRRDEKQHEKACEVEHTAETSNKESNVSSGEGDRQNTETVQGNKEAVESTSVDYPQADKEADSSSVDYPQANKGADRSTSIDYPQAKKEDDSSSVDYPPANSEEDSSSVDYPQATLCAEEGQSAVPDILVENSNIKDADAASEIRPDVELPAEKTNTDPNRTSTLSDSIEEVSAEATVQASQNVSVYDSKFALEDSPQQKSDCSENVSLVKREEVLAENSNIKDSASETTPDAVLAAEETNTDQNTTSALTNVKEEVSAEATVQASQDVSVSDNTFASEDSPQQKSDCSENVSLVKHKLKSEVSEEDNVFDDGTKSQSSIADSKNIEPSNLERSRSQSASESQPEKPETKVQEERPVREMLVRRSRTESTDSNTDRPVVEHLTFNVAKNIDTIKDEEVKANDMCECLLCDRAYPAYNKEDILAHMVLMHKFVIADVNFIGILPEYMRYWKKRFEDKPFSEFCSKIVTNAGVKDDASKEEFFLLCDALPEDKALREDLQRKKLESVLAQQQKEREETKFCRQCLFCTQTFCGNRAILLDHLVRDHAFHVGQPDNLVFTDELFNLIQSKLDSLLCLFCEKAFKDKPSLREHMRKKQHRKINPKHKEYDRFYIVNYMEMGKNWQSLQSEDSRIDKASEKSVNEEDEWSGWNEESASKFVCLFCDMTCVAVTELLDHMKETHSFDLHELSTKLQLNFYQKVKIINFIRKQVYLNICYGCQQTFNAKEELLAHLNESPTHSQNLPDAEAWDQEIYFVPTYEDDRLLCSLEDDYGEDDDDTSGDGAAGDNLDVAVIKEDIPIPDTILLKDKKLCQELLKT
ncbi:hypothetical protein BsWGS_12071 [Bradybaena similaris]